MARLLPLIVFLPVVLTAVTMAPLRALGVGDFRTRYHAASLLYSLYSAATVLALLKLLPSTGLTRRDLGLVRPSVKDVVLGVVLLPAGFVPWVAAYLLAPGLFRGLERGMFPKIGLWEVPIQVVYAVLAAPICEEILFRGFLVTYLERALGNTWLAAVASVAAFALIHVPRWGLAAVPVMAAWALVPTALFVWRRNLAAPMAYHMSNNVYAHVLMRL